MVGAVIEGTPVVPIGATVTVGATVTIRVTVQGGFMTSQVYLYHHVGATVTIRVTVAVTLRAEVQHAFGSDTGLSSRRLLRLHLLQLRVRWRWGYG